ncbi:hypothetical protein PLESTM_000486600 [Pleodorina starrii]|nr:hypothetical protein PLESTM_000486600 [Pleodorina starrii]
MPQHVWHREDAASWHPAAAMSEATAVLSQRSVPPGQQRSCRRRGGPEQRPFRAASLPPDQPLLRVDLFAAPDLAEAGVDPGGGSQSGGTLVGTGLVGGHSLDRDAAVRLQQGQRVTLTVALGEAAEAAETQVGPATSSRGLAPHEVLLEMVLLDAATSTGAPGEAAGGGPSAAAADALEALVRECLDKQAALGQVARQLDSAVVQSEEVSWRLVDAEKRCRSLLEDNGRLQQLLHAEQQAWRIPQLRMMVDSAMLSREELMERCESVMAAYGRERARNGELVERLRMLHGEQVDALELKKRYQQLQEAHEAQARAYTETEEAGGRVAQLRATVKTQEEIIRNLEALLARAVHQAKPPREQDAPAAEQSVAPTPAPSAAGAGQDQVQQDAAAAAPDIAAAATAAADAAVAAAEAAAAAAAAAEVAELRAQLTASQQRVEALEAEMAAQQSEAAERVARMEAELEALRQHTVTEFPALTVEPPPPPPKGESGEKTAAEAAAEGGEEAGDGRRSAEEDVSGKGVGMGAAGDGDGAGGEQEKEGEKEVKKETETEREREEREERERELRERLAQVEGELAAGRERVEQLEGELAAARERIRELEGEVAEAAAKAAEAEQAAAKAAEAEQDKGEGGKEAAAAAEEEIRRLQGELAAVSEERTAAQLRAEYAEGAAEAAQGELVEVTRRYAREIAGLKTRLAEKDAAMRGGFGGLDQLAASTPPPPFPAIPAGLGPSSFPDASAAAAGGAGAGARTAIDPRAAKPPSPVSAPGPAPAALPPSGSSALADSPGSGRLRLGQRRASRLRQRSSESGEAMSRRQSEEPTTQAAGGLGSGAAAAAAEPHGAPGGSALAPAPLAATASAGEPSALENTASGRPLAWMKSRRGRVGRSSRKGEEAMLGTAASAEPQAAE